MCASTSGATSTVQVTMPIVPGAALLTALASCT